MCGIAGIFAYGVGAPPVDERELLAVRDAMARRGPDGARAWFSPDRRVGLGHRRLAIIDLSESGAQPMAYDPPDAPPSPAGHRYVITFNGEIYNYRELRTRLEAEGETFASRSDTEVILHLYHRHGAQAVRLLRGMYAFALWDRERRGVLLARDPFGIKPLYYADDGATLRFASQVKALLAGGAIDPAPEPAGHAGFFLFGSVPEPFTLHRAVKGLPAGSMLWIDAEGTQRLDHFFETTQVLAATPGAPPPSAEELRAALLDSVRAHLVADVPVGVFLSSGLDSATIAALAAEAGSGELVTMTLAFDEFAGTPFDEAPLAEEVARGLGSRHRTVRVTGADFRRRLPDVLTAMDQPSIDGVNVYFVAEAAAGLGLKVALSGLGGDEMFAGYDVFRQVPRLVNAVRPVARPRLIGWLLRRLAAPLLGRVASPKHAGLLEYGGTYGGAYLLKRGLFMPWELPQVMDPDLARAGLDALQPLARLDGCHAPLAGARPKVTALETAWYMRNQLLRDADWAGMAHSLEIRVPLVDEALFRRLAPSLGHPRAPGKRAMAATPARALPAAVLDRPKTGFAVPVREWLAGETAETGPKTRGYRAWARRIYAEFAKP
jgi:asparagine synthase (glutamine-hydrolysing)